LPHVAPMAGHATSRLASADVQSEQLEHANVLPVLVLYALAMQAPVSPVVVHRLYVLDAVQAAGEVQVTEVQWVMSAASAAEQSEQLAQL
jgi:hypothetical protein